MPGSLLKSIWRRMTGNAAAQALPGARSEGVSLQFEARSALASLLREPPAYPKPGDDEMVAPEWRDLRSSDTMPRYPSARLFRQPRPRQREPVLVEAAVALRRPRDARGV
jgi:hypothetical protein